MEPIKNKIRLSRLTRVDLAFLSFKFVLALTLFGVLPQSLTFQNLTAFSFVLWAAVSLAGLVTSIIGLILGAQDESTRQRGFRIETVGLWLLLAGPLSFAAVQVGLALTPGSRGWSWVGIMFPMVVASAIWARKVMVKASMRTVLYRFPGEDDND